MSSKMDIAAIARPKLLMAAATDLVQRRKFQGKNNQLLGNQALEKLIETEAAQEELRQNTPANYHAEQHIELLARLIEQARLLMPKMGSA